MYSTARRNDDHYSAFIAMMRTLYDYCGYNWVEKTDRRMSVIYEYVKDLHIPIACFQPIGKRLQDHIDSPTGNIGKKIREAWQEVAQTLPEVQHARSECKACNGSGIIGAEKRDDVMGTTYSYAFRCARCENWRGVYGTAIAAATREMLEANGYTVKGFSPSPSEQEKKEFYRGLAERNRRKLAGLAVGEDVSDEKDKSRKEWIRERQLKAERMREVGEDG